jgi:shikimate dehydrogenase
VVRDPARAGALLVAAERLGVAVRLAAWPAGDALAEASLVITTVPAGAADALAGAGWPPGLPLFEVLYAPWPTPLAQAALQAGATVVGGLELLVHQAVLQVELMTGLRPDPEVLLTAGAAALAARAS